MALTYVFLKKCYSTNLFIYNTEGARILINNATHVYYSFFKKLKFILSYIGLWKIRLSWNLVLFWDDVIVRNTFKKLIS